MHRLLQSHAQSDSTLDSLLEVLQARAALAKYYEGAEIGTGNKTVAVILTADAVEVTEEERANGNRI